MVHMLIVQVEVHVKAEFVEAFREATIENARNSVKEAGIARFDFSQQADNPTRFLLIEVYRDPSAPARHRETAHYLKWRDVVAPMMDGDRIRMEYHNVFPPDQDW